MNLDPYDAKRDQDSESLYDHDSRAEPQQWELDESRYERDHGGYILDEDSGFRG
jgi:hypothetical protein